jgi:hypothetical protein
MNADVSNYHKDKGWETGRSAVADLEAPLCKDSIANIASKVENDGRRMSRNLLTLVG